MTHTVPEADGRIEVRADGAVGRIVIDHPARRNALTHAMWLALPAAVATLDADPAVRVIVLSGAGDTFSSGADITEFDDLWTTASPDYEASTVAAFAALRRASRPTLAVIAGPCMGGAVGLAAACDVRLAASSARFAIPAARLGLAYPPAAVADIVALIGPGRTRDLMFTGRSIDADAALAIGLVECRYADEEFFERTAAYVDTVAALAPLTHRATKAAVTAALRPGAATQRPAADAVADCLASADYGEGRAAFSARRRPVFRGV